MPTPPVENQFKPGQSGNPGGRPKVPEDIREARKLNQVELERVVNRYLFLTAAEVAAAQAEPTTPMMELMVAALMVKAVKSGDQARLDFILNRLIGKPKQVFEHTGAGGGSILSGAPIALDAAIKVLTTDYAAQPPVPVKVEEL